MGILTVTDAPYHAPPIDAGFELKPATSGMFIPSAPYQGLKRLDPARELSEQLRDCREFNSWPDWVTYFNDVDPLATPNFSATMIAQLVAAEWPQGMEDVLLEAYRRREGLFVVQRRTFTATVPDAWERVGLTEAAIAGDYEPHTARFVREFLRPGDIAVDVGAHHGYFAKIMAEAVGLTGDVVAYEPDPENVAKLSALNLPKLTIRPVVVGDKLGMVDFYVNPDNDGGHALWNPGLHPFNEQARKVESKRSIMMVPLVGEITSARLVKIDAEGAEGLILAGMADLLAKKSVDAIILEINSFALEQMGSSEAKIRRTMREHGYHAYLLEQWPPIPLSDDQSYQSEYVYNLLFLAPGVAPFWEN